MHPFQSLISKETRVVVGLMSGTSLDGVDAAVARLSGSGRALQLDVLAARSFPYPVALRRVLLRNSAADTSSVFDLSQLNVRLAYQYADAVRQIVYAAGLSLADLDLVGSHGQTVHHIPDATDCAALAVTSTLQIGDPSVLANLLDVPVVGDFRVADMALGGQGAPLVPYFDYVYFSDAAEQRGLLNVGGIANLTVLPRGGGPEAVRAFDTGPANMVIDALADRFFDQPYDPDGALAAQGTVHQPLLDALMDDAYYDLPPPKSTGREHFGRAYVARLVEDAEAAGLSPNDMLATATALTAHSVYHAYDAFFRGTHPLDVLIVSGGGMHNAVLMDMLAKLFAPVPVHTVEPYGLDSDEKEALCFAVLAHETVNGVPTNLPSVTGAAHPTLLGKLCFPFRVKGE